MMLYPKAYIGKFLDNIRTLVIENAKDSSEGSTQKTFQTIIEAFDQLNMERSNLVNEQGKLITNFSEQITNYGRAVAGDKKSEMVDILANGGLRQMFIDFNKGDLFNATAVSTGQQLIKGEAKTEDLKSVTGEKLSADNPILKMKGEDIVTPAGRGTELGAEVEDYVMPEQKEEPKMTGTQVVLPPELNPAPLPDPDMTPGRDGKTLVEQWKEHQTTRRRMIRDGMDSKEVAKQGFEALTYEEFKNRYKQKNPPTKEETEKEKEIKEQRLVGLRMAKDIEAYHHQGKLADAAAFKIGGSPSTLMVETDGLDQRLLLFSPEWQKINGSATISDDDLLAELGI